MQRGNFSFRVKIRRSGTDGDGFIFNPYTSLPDAKG